MEELLREYRARMGWNDQSVIDILCGFIEAQLRPSLELHERVEALQAYLEAEASEEESACEGTDDQGRGKRPH